jgi:hypothetical protein
VSTNTCDGQSRSARSSTASTCSARKAAGPQPRCNMEGGGRGACWSSLRVLAGAAGSRVGPHPAPAIRRGGGGGCGREGVVDPPDDDGATGTNSTGTAPQRHRHGGTAPPAQRHRHSATATAPPANPAPAVPPPKPVRLHHGRHPQRQPLGRARPSRPRPGTAAPPPRRARPCHRPRAARPCERGYSTASHRSRAGTAAHRAPHPGMPAQRRAADALRRSGRPRAGLTRRHGSWARVARLGLSGSRLQLERARSESMEGAPGRRSASTARPGAGPRSSSDRTLKLRIHVSESVKAGPQRVAIPPRDHRRRGLWGWTPGSFLQTGGPAPTRARAAGRRRAPDAAQARPCYGRCHDDCRRR